MFLHVDGGRPTRATAARTNLRIRATLDDARAGIWDIGASVTHSIARANISSRAPLQPLRATHTATNGGSKNDDTRWLRITTYKPAL